MAFCTTKGRTTNPYFPLLPKRGRNNGKDKVVEKARTIKYDSHLKYHDRLKTALCTY
jgi:hypothetical protein